MKLNYSDSLSSLNETLRKLQIRSSKNTPQKQDNRKQRFSSNEPKTSKHKKAKPPQSAFESRLEFYSNFLQEFKDQKTKKQKPINYSREKFRSKRGIFSASPPKIAEEAPKIDTKAMNRQIFGQRMDQSNRESQRRSMIHSHNPSPDRSILFNSILL